MKQKNITGAVQPGQVVWAFRCKHCQAPIAILNELAELDSVVDLKCPKCGQTHSYPKTEARRAQAHTKQ
ncbi:MAG: MJ0042-type zinc finger domain-containing protein [Rhodomicrobiaceae bacterium]